MLWDLLSWIRHRVAVADPEDRIEGTDEAIRSPQHRWSREAERQLEMGDRYGGHDRE